MATTTPNLGLTKPTVGADADAWGGQLNASLDTLDVKVLDKTTGGTVSGNLSVTGTVNTPNVNAAATLNLQTGGSTKATLDSAGNLGLGVTPSAWNASSKAFQFGANGAASVENFNGVANNLMQNAFRNSAGNFLYLTASQASLYSQNTGSHQWLTAPSGTAGAPITFTQAMTLTQGGNLLVGTTADSGDRIFTPGQMRADGGLRVVNNGIVNLYGANGSGAVLSSDVGSVLIGTGTTGVITLSTNNTERARITSAGDFLVGRASPRDSEIFSVSASRANFVSEFANTATTGSPNVVLAFYPNFSPNNTISSFYRGADSSATRFEVRSNGGVANFQANNVNLSDRREKTNFAPAKSYLDVICAIPVQTFNYVDQNLEDDPGLTLGVVAQDVQAVAPELVMESNWGTKDDPKMRLSIYQTDLQYALMKCIQEQQTMIAALESRLAALEAK